MIYIYFLHYICLPNIYLPPSRELTRQAYDHLWNFEKGQQQATSQNGCHRQLDQWQNSCWGTRQKCWNFPSQHPFKMVAAISGWHFLQSQKWCFLRSSELPSFPVSWRNASIPAVCLPVPQTPGGEKGKWSEQPSSWQSTDIVSNRSKKWHSGCSRMYKGVTSGQAGPGNPLEKNWGQAC